MSQVYKKTDTLATRDEVVSLLRGTTLVTRPVPSEDKTEPLSLHAHARQPESLIISYNGDDPGNLPSRYKIELLNRQLRGELRQATGEKACSR